MKFSSFTLAFHPKELELFLVMVLAVLVGVRRVARAEEDFGGKQALFVTS